MSIERLDSADAGAYCYVTGGEGGPADQHDLDGGPTALISPAFDVPVDTATLQYAYWFLTDQPGASLLVYAAPDGGAWQFIKKHSVPAGTWRTHVATLAGPSSFRLKFVVQDAGGGFLTEALVDHVRVYVPDCGMAHWSACLLGPLTPVTGNCLPLDADGDADIDLHDFAVHLAGHSTDLK